MDGELLVLITHVIGMFTASDVGKHPLDALAGAQHPAATGLLGRIEDHGDLHHASIEACHA